MKNEYKTLEDVARNLYINVFWTHKIHEKQAEIYDCFYGWLKGINIFFAALTSAGVIALIFEDPMGLKVASAACAFVTTALSAFLASFDFKAMATSNKTSAVKLVGLRNELLVILAKIQFQKQDIAVLMQEYESIQKRVHEVYELASKTTKHAVKKADFSINKNKDGIYTDAEIDALLPDSLKRGSAN